MTNTQYKIFGKKVVIKTDELLTLKSEDLVTSSLFREMITKCIDDLKKRESILLNIFDGNEITKKMIDKLIQIFQFLAKMSSDLVPNVVEGSEIFFRDPDLLNGFLQHLYNYWRSFDRFLICQFRGGALDKRPYRTFNITSEELTHLVRGTYRDIHENIRGIHPRIYRQVRAGASVTSIAYPYEIGFVKKYCKKLKEIPIVRQVLLYPPAVLEPPMNKRTGQFRKVDKNPLDLVNINKDEWICYPAKVGDLLIHVYIHQNFYELGFSLANLFELAEDEELARKPDAIYLYGVEKKEIDSLDNFPTVFFDDQKNDILVAAVPNSSEFGYFGYLKKMILTLHNIQKMKRGIFPFHGALVKIYLKGNKNATILLIGDTAAGKSETLEALRVIGGEYIRDIVIIADDMGSLEIDDNGDIKGYGTEIGAFLRLDDLNPGYAFGQMDRAIIMGPGKTNARIVLPVTTYEKIIEGYNVDYILYANNYENIGESFPILEKFNNFEDALRVFREGKVMSKGTTTSIGIVHSYFANIFGPPQYRELHESLAKKYFEAFFKKDIFVGQMRTRLGLDGFERHGPEEASVELLKRIKD